MYKQKYYKRLDQAAIAQEVRKEGFAPILVYNEPGYIYRNHSQPETKLLVFLKGTMDVTVGDIIYHCSAGDKMVIPGNTPHSAQVGEDGCMFYWSEKLIEA